MSTIDLSALPAPEIVEALDFEAILATIKTDFVARYPDIAAVIDLESDPIVKLLETLAYRELTLRARINDAARGVMLAYAIGTDLDQIGGNYGVARLVVTPADTSTIPPTPVVMENDADYRRRILLSLDGYTTAGSRLAYIYHALSASGQVKDAAAESTAPGIVNVYILGRSGNGSADENLLNTVTAALNADDVRPMTDKLTVHSAAIVTWDIAAHLIVDSGPDAEVIRAAALAAATDYAAAQHRMGADISLSGVYRALHQAGVTRVDLAAPVANIAISPGQAPWCTGIALTAGTEA